MIDICQAEKNVLLSNINKKIAKKEEEIRKLEIEFFAISQIETEQIEIKGE